MRIILFLVLSVCWARVAPKRLEHNPFGDAKPIPPPHPVIKDPSVASIETIFEPKFSIDKDPMFSARLKYKEVAFQKELDGSKACELGPTGRLRRINLIGENHTDCELCQKAMMERIEEASSKKRKPPPSPMLVFEGADFSFNGSKLEPEFGSAYGVEWPLATGFSSALMVDLTAQRLMIETAAKPPKQAIGEFIDPLRGFMEALVFDRELNALWIKFAQSKTLFNGKMLGKITSVARRAEPLLTSSQPMNDKAVGWLKKPINSVLFDMIGRSEELPEIESFIREFMNGPFRQAIEKHPSPYKMDLSDLKAELEPHPKQTLEEFKKREWKLTLRYTIDWRNRIMAKHLLKAFCQAANEGRDLDFTVGYLHVPGLWAALRSEMPSIGGSSEQVAISSMRSHLDHKHFDLGATEMKAIRGRECAYDSHFNTSTYEKRLDPNAFKMNVACLISP